MLSGNKTIQFIIKNWHLILIGAFFLCAGLLYLIVGQDSTIAVHDNLDLFVAQLRMLQNTNGFFAHGNGMIAKTAYRDGSIAQFLHGISRNTLPSELSLYTVLYMIFPTFTAYIIGYFVKVAIAIWGFYLLFRKYDKKLAILCGFAYGLLNMFPAYGIPFSSIPLLLYLLTVIYKHSLNDAYVSDNMSSRTSGKKTKVNEASGKKSNLWLYYLGVFCYPFVSYFSYFGLFLCAYLLLAVIIISIINKKLNLHLLLALILLGLGCVAFEYRLFAQMLFSSEPSIRTTMVAGDMTGSEIVHQIVSVFAEGMMHAESVHTWFVMPICLILGLLHNIKLIKDNSVRNETDGKYNQRENNSENIHSQEKNELGNKKQGKKLCGIIFSDLSNLIFLTLVFNSFIYGIYYQPAFRGIIETLLPPLKGWQFNRTVFFNPFLWYMWLFVCLYNVICENKKLLPIAYGVVLASIAIILLSPTRYNDLYFTAKNEALRVLKDKTPDALSYREFYDQSLFEDAKQQIGYNDEWAVAYGFHPGVLEYNDIYTLDGYLGFYSQEYKEQFRKIIAPALDRVEASRLYYDEWGARAYLYSGTDLSCIKATRSFTVSDYDLYIDTEAFKALDGKYIFSAYKLTNADELGLSLLYEGKGLAYELYVYKAL